MMSNSTFGDNYNSLSVILILIIVSLLVATGFLFAFIWSVSKGQYEDEISPSIRMLFEDRATDNNPSSSQNP
jgi:cbb3-type cytochrome oxidase maturation protein